MVLTIITERVNPCFRISLLSADMIKIQISKIYFQTQPLSFALFMIRCQKDSGGFQL